MDFEEALRQWCARNLQVTLSHFDRDNGLLDLVLDLYVNGVVVSTATTMVDLNELLRKPEPEPDPPSDERNPRGVRLDRTESPVV